MSNLAYIACKSTVRHYASKVGDRYVLEDMQRRDIIGGEDSGHDFPGPSYHRRRSLTALQLISVMPKQATPVELAQLMDVYPQRLLNVPVQQTRYLHRALPWK
jgi:phosphoglucosamine mutase